MRYLLLRSFGTANPRVDLNFHRLNALTNVGRALPDGARMTEV